MADIARALQSQNIWYNSVLYRQAEINLARFNLGISTPNSPQVVKKEIVQNQTENAPKPAQNKASAMVSALKENLVKTGNTCTNELTTMLGRVQKLEEENETIKNQLLQALERLDLLEKSCKETTVDSKTVETNTVPAKVEETKKVEEDDDDSDDDFFGSSDDEETDRKAEELKIKRIAEYNARKAKKEETKGKVLAKSSVTLDVKPYSDETDLKEVEKLVREIEMDGLVWGASKFGKIAYGLEKLVILCVIEDDKVSTDDLVDRIDEFEDVQSVDIAAFVKI